MTVFDYVFLGVLGLSAAVGLWRGLISEVMAVLAWVAALLAAWLWHPHAAGLFVGMIAEPVWRQVAGVAVIVVGVLLLAALVRYLLRQLLRAAGLGPADRFFGAIFGLARGLAIVFVAVLLGGLVGMSREAWWAQSLFAPPMERAVIAAKPWLPDAVANRIRFR
ncbi:MAG: CvpA family protein [Thauera phenolivorans]|uniref:CvpA family protein n=1 Tax=Thauera phenolivorans TaxID=1792543 RepID=A0A7X7LZ21_9RHOO|nr:CvpA family protein [Thauera phenolivorans]NLF55760.1 CvpA family protein [Thauera phenolivorans]